MEYRRLGKTGLMVSELCLGCMTFGREVDEEGSKEIVERFLGAGGNFIDAWISWKTTSGQQVGSFLQSSSRGSRRLALSRMSTLIA